MFISNFTSLTDHEFILLLVYDIILYYIISVILHDIVHVQKYPLSVKNSFSLHQILKYIFIFLSH